YRSDDDNLYCSVVAIWLKESRRIEKMARSIRQDLSEETRQQLKLDHVELDGTSVSFVSLGATGPFEASHGSNDLYFAFTNDALIMAIGKHGLERMKDTITKLKDPVPKDTKPIRIEVSLSKLGGLTGGTSNWFANALSKAFSSGDKDKDKIS